MDKDLILREKLSIQRTQMANQTTLLSFIRTSLYFAVAGLSIENVLQLTNFRWIEQVLYVSSALLAILGMANYVYQHRRIEESKKHVGTYLDEYESE